MHAFLIAGLEWEEKDLFLFSANRFYTKHSKIFDHHTKYKATLEQINQFSGKTDFAACKEFVDLRWKIFFFMIYSFNFVKLNYKDWLECFLCLFEIHVTLLCKLQRFVVFFLLFKFEIQVLCCQKQALVYQDDLIFHKTAFFITAFSYTCIFSLWVML